MILFLIATLTACVGTRPPTPTVAPSPVPTQVSAKDGMAQVYVPAGEFLMGSADSDSSAFSDEKPQHKVYLDAFWIDKTGVTNAMFAKFVAATNYKTEAEKAGGGLFIIRLQRAGSAQKALIGSIRVGRPAISMV